MPYPVISGFMSGIGCILIIMQLNPLLGFTAPHSVVNALSVLPGFLTHPNLQTVAVGIAALAVTVLVPKKLTRIVPAPLVALLLASFLAMTMDTVPVLGAMPSGLPELQIPQLDMKELNGMLLSAVVLAALGSIDSLLTSLVADNVSRTYHDSDKELVGQGIGNIAAGLIGGLPGAGATIRTLSNFHAGGRSYLSGIIHALVLVVFLFGLGKLVAYIPYAALAGILIKVGIDVIDWRFLRRLHRAPRTDLVLVLVVLFLTIFVDVITAVGTGVILASLLFVKEMAEHQLNSIRAISDPDHERLFTPADAELFRRCREHALYLHLSGPVSFGAANEMVRKFSNVGTYQVMVIDLLDVPHIDGSAALALEEVIQRAVEADKTVFIVGMTTPVRNLMRRLGSLNLVPETHLIKTRSETVLAVLEELQKQGLAEA
jgi:SulP family sulfate permease